MSVEIPPGVSADGNVKVAFTPTLSTPTAPMVTELVAIATVDISCHLTADGFTPGGEASTTEDRRLCSKQVFEGYGTVTYSIDNLIYIYDPQVPASLSNEAYAAMPAGSVGYLVVRWGLDSRTAWTVGQTVDVYPVTMGPRIKQAPETNGKLKVKQKPFVTGLLYEDVLLVA